MNTPVLSRWRLPRSDSEAFTSIELLVVIAVLLVLAAITFPALVRSKEKDIRVACVNNEKQLFTSLQMYSDDNADRLPTLGSVGSWAIDLPTPITGAITSYGSAKKNFYCPSTAPRFTDMQNWAAANSLWNFGVSGGFNVVGYTFAFGGIASKIAVPFQNLTLLSELHTNGPTVTADIPATREVIADVMVSLANNLPATGIDNFTSLTGGFTQNGVSYPLQSAHLGRALLPAGGNNAFKDGHVQWRKFDASQGTPTANNTKVRTSTNPYFWW